MTISITNPTNLIRRKKLKGDELGRALLLSLVHDYYQRESEAPSPLFSQDDLERMEKSLSSEYDRSRYSGYVELHKSLLQLFRDAQGQLQQLQHGLYRLNSSLTLAERVLHLQKLLKPLVETSQYPEFKILPETIHALFPEDFSGMLENVTLQNELRAARDLMVLPAYSWLTGYNTMLDIFAQGLPLKELCALRIELNIIRSIKPDYDTLLTKGLAILPANDAQALRSILKPLALEKINPDHSLVQFYIKNVQTNGPSGCYPPDDMIEHIMGTWKEE